MSRPMVQIHNATTGEVIEREMNDEEFAQWQKDMADALAREQAAIEAVAKRQAALDKLAALGLEPDDLKALGL